MEKKKKKRKEEQKRKWKEKTKIKWKKIIIKKKRILRDLMDSLWKPIR